MATLEINSKTYGQIYAKVDDQDYEKIKDYKWSANYNKKSRKYYVRCANLDGRKNVYLHRYICEIHRMDVTNFNCDHINNNTLDNHSSNLRPSTYSENSMNSLKRSGASSIFKGVSWNKLCSKWMTQIQVDRKKIYIGLYETQTGAAIAFNEAAKKYHGEFAYLNAV